MFIPYYVEIIKIVLKLHKSKVQHKNKTSKYIELKIIFQ